MWRESMVTYTSTETRVEQGSEKNCQSFHNSPLNAPPNGRSTGGSNASNSFCVSDCNSRSDIGPLWDARRACRSRSTRDSGKLSRYATMHRCTFTFSIMIHQVPSVWMGSACRNMSNRHSNLLPLGVILRHNWHIDKR